MLDHIFYDKRIRDLVKNQIVKNITQKKKKNSSLAKILVRF